MKQVMLWTLLVPVACEQSGTGAPESPLETTLGMAEGAAAVFDPLKFTDYHLTMDPADWDAIIWTPQVETYRKADLEWEGQTLAEIGVRATGESSRTPGNQKMSLKLKFNKFVSGQKFHGLKELKLDGMSADASMMKDRISYGVFGHRIAAPRAVHCRLFVNGEYRGVYLVEELVDDVMMKDRFGSQLGNLYRIRVSGGDPYLWAGPAVGSYVPLPWEPKTNEQTADHTRVVHFVDVLNNDPAAFGGVCDVDSLLEYFAVEAAVCDTDGVAGDFGVNNHFQYYRLQSQRFTIVPWDLDATWGFDDWQQTTRSIFRNFQTTKLAALVENDPVLNQAYKDKIAEIIDTLTLPENIEAEVDLIYAQISQAVYEDPNKPYTNAQFENGCQFIKDFALSRYLNLWKQLVQP